MGTPLGGSTRERSIYTVLSMWVCTLHHMGTCSRDLCIILSFHVDFHNSVFLILMKTRANTESRPENCMSLSCLVAEICRFKVF